RETASSAPRWWTVHSGSLPTARFERARIRPPRMIRLDLAVPTDWTRIDQVREAVGHSVAAVFGDRDLEDALALGSAELLENALKYGRPTQGDVRISLRDDQGRLVITVTNEVDEGSEHARLLDQLVRWVREQASPLAAYEAALARTMSEEEAMRSGL